MQTEPRERGTDGVTFRGEGGGGAGLTQEIGTWTPLDFSSGGPGINSVGSPTYVKTGRVVQVFAVISYNPNVSASLAVIGNLPFPVDPENSFNQFAPGFEVGGAVGMLSPRLSVAFGGQIHFYGGSPAARVTNADLSGLTEIPFCFTYLTA